MADNATRSCTKCGTLKPIGEFYLNCYGRNGACNDCVKAKNRAYYEQKKADIAAKHAIRRAERTPVNMGAVDQRREADFTKRYNARRGSVNANKRERLQKDPQYRAVTVVETQLRRALADPEADFASKVGLSQTKFREWIMYQWAPEMSWDNYGTYWNYDHVIPKSAYDFRIPAQVEACNRWTNWRPVVCAENSRKSVKRDAALEAEQEITASIFEIIQEIDLRGNNARD